ELGHRPHRRPGAHAQALHRRAAPGVRLRPGRSRGHPESRGARGAPRDANAGRGRPGRQRPGRVSAQRRPGRRGSLGGARRPRTIRFRGPAKKLTASAYLVQLLAVRPGAFDRVRTKITAEELDADDRPVYVRMLGSYERGGPAGLEADLAGYPPEEQDLIRRAWAAPPPNVDDEVAVELADRIRLEHMKGMHSGII